MSLTYLLYDLRRPLRGVTNMFFIAVLPATLYVIFGVVQGWSNESVGHGNVSSYIMVSMAAYGAITATTSIAGAAAVERMQGWGRQLAMTPMGTTNYSVTKIIVAVVVAVVPVVLVYAVGFFTSAEIEDVWRWFVTATLILAGSIIFAAYGLAAGLLFRSDGAVSAASGLLVVLAFFGNVFMPLNDSLLGIARFTPMYGIVGLARYPITDGQVATVDGIHQDSIWLLLTNVSVWALIFAAIVVLAARKATARS